MQFIKSLTGNEQVVINYTNTTLPKNKIPQYSDEFCSIGRLDDSIKFILNSYFDFQFIDDYTKLFDMMKNDANFHNFKNFNILFVDDNLSIDIRDLT